MHVNWANIGDAWREKTLTAAGILAAVVLLFFSCIPISGTTALVYDASRYGFALLVFSLVIFQSLRIWFLTYRQGFVRPWLSFKTYAVPQRFGIGTLLIVIVAFAIFSALLRVSTMEPYQAFVLLAFACVIAALQFVFHLAPRRASMIGGGCFLLILAYAEWLTSAPSRRIAQPAEIAFLAALWVVIGAILGYLTGSLIGMIFMLMAVADRLLGRRDEDGSSPEAAKLDSTQPSIQADAELHHCQLP
jgi:hypothetical protein